MTFFDHNKMKTEKLYAVLLTTMFKCYFNIVTYNELKMQYFVFLIMLLHNECYASVPSRRVSNQPIKMWFNTKVSVLTKYYLDSFSSFSEVQKELDKVMWFLNMLSGAIFWQSTTPWSLEPMKVTKLCISSFALLGLHCSCL